MQSVHPLSAVQASLAWPSQGVLDSRLGLSTAGLLNSWGDHHQYYQVKRAQDCADLS